MDEHFRDILRATIKDAFFSPSFLRVTFDGPVSINEDLKDESPKQERDPRVRKLIEGILFSRSFVVTYQYALLGLLALFTVFYWTKKIRGRYRVRHGITAEAEDGGAADYKADEVREQSAGSSESSSTLDGTATPPDAAKYTTREIESTPLLSRSNRPSPKTVRPWNVIKSWLMYQPRPIPMIHKTLPDNGTSLLILAFIGLNIFYTFYGIPFSINMIFVVGDRAGLMFVANLPLLYLFAAKNQPIKFLTGYSYEALNIFHRRLGEFMCLLALLHSVSMFTIYIVISGPRGLTLGQFLMAPIILLGILTFICYETIYFTSLGSFRSHFYELFLVSHVILQVAALVLLWFHHAGSRPYVGVALGVFFIDRLVFRILIKTSRLTADLSVLPDGETVLVSSNWSIPTCSIWQQLFPGSVVRGWKPTDHVFLTVPALSRAHKIQAHPFTIASAAPVSPVKRPDYESATINPHAWFSLLIRARDGFSRDLLRYAETHEKALIRLDGPYGSPHCLESLLPCDLVVVVAGGSGIAVAFPILWTLLYDRSSHPRRSQKVCLLWLVHSRKHLEWLPKERLDELKKLDLEVVIPKPTSEAGRPDVPTLITDLVERFGDRKRIGVTVSGPGGMDRVVRNACARLVKEDRDVSVQVEKFEW